MYFFSYWKRKHEECQLVIVIFLMYDAFNKHSTISHFPQNWRIGWWDENQANC
ncbi:hypothetical protein PAECIP111894_02710 [Paenibacillus pseudetheri]|uniref:Uncharacterized protein n=1 Tax=Paenibacillus pseudetheri TaxID=2897682 RepID=A0ABM9BCT9_9BACL|nr:hypothetical protein PAECIP111894_02710 [Paenibacillus pseudetheri]